MEKEKMRFVLLGGGLVVLIVVAAALYNVLPGILGEQLEIDPLPESAEASSIPEEELMDAPDFTVMDAQGEEVRFSELTGVPIVVNFWASWCGPCQMEMPDFDDVWASYDDDTVRFMMINATDGQRETLEAAQTYIQEGGFGFPVYYDVDLDAVSTYGVRAFPSTVFINSDGKLVGAVEGAISEATLRRGISLILP